MRKVLFLSMFPKLVLRRFALLGRGELSASFACKLGLACSHILFSSRVAMEWRSLPVELQEEILSRVPAKSLARLRSTSKQWKALFKVESFAKKHSANAAKESHIMMLIDFRVYIVGANLHEIHNVLYLKDPFSNSSQVDIRKVFQCDSLLLCTTKDYRLVVWNPFSGETKWIKPRNSCKHSDLYALGYHIKSSCKVYKILRVDRQYDLIDNTCEIYDFTTDSWRVLGASRVTTGGFFLRCCRSVFVKGNAYWVVRFSMSPYDSFLLSFDFSTERFQNLSLPQPFPLNYYPTLSVGKEEQLCLLCYRRYAIISGEINVWVTTSIGSVMSWTKVLTVQNVDQYLSIPKFFVGMFSFVADEKNKVVVCCNDDFPNRTLHIMEGNSQIQNVNYLGGDSTRRSDCSVLMNYVPSLARIQQGLLLGGLKRKTPSM